MSRVMIFVCTFPFLIGGFLTLCMPSPAHAQDAVFFPIVVKQSTPSVESKLPDTGIYFCTDGTDKIDCPGFGEAFYGQDAHSNPWPQQHSYTDNEDGTVTDEVTGLMWMQNTADTNEDQAIDDNDKKSWTDAVDYCAGLEPPDALAAGHSDWRLPEITELRTLRDLGRFDPTIDPVFSCRSSSHWTSSPYAGSSGNAWRVYFYDGFAYGSNKGNPYYVRCVRSGP